MTCAAGEHFVAFKLSALGFPVAATRGGSPTIDLMVGNLSGSAALSIQVKTDNWAWRPRKRNPSSSHWEWYVGHKALNIRGECIYYAFVDLKWEGASRPQMPDVFIVPSIDVANRLGPDWKMYRFWIMETEGPKYLERWDLITSRLYCLESSSSLSKSGSCRQAPV